MMRIHEKDADSNADLDPQHGDDHRQLRLGEGGKGGMGTDMVVVMCDTVWTLQGILSIPAIIV